MEQKKNPDGELEELSHTLTPEGAASLGIFLVLSQQFNYRIYSLGQLVDGKKIKSPFGNIHFDGKLGRAIAPGAALAGAYFISSHFVELMHDQNVHKCAKQLFSDNDNASDASDNENTFDHESTVPVYMGACEQAYIHWVGAGRLRIYAVDMFFLLGSGWLSQKMYEIMLTAIRSTTVTSNILLRIGKMIGLRAARLGRFLFPDIFFYRTQSNN